MRTVIFSINVSLDGCCDHTKTGGGSDDILDYFAQLLRDSDTIVSGRITHQLMVPFWPDEYRIVVHPVIAGEGRRLFDDVSLQEKLQLKLADTKVLRSGCVALHYVK